MSPNEGQEEYKEIQEDILRKEQQFSSFNELESMEEGNIIHNTRSFYKRLISSTCSKYFKNDNLMRLLCTVGIQAFTLTFLAEWGDRSQIATIVLSAKEDIKGVSIGAIIGHSLCTLLAVMSGRFISTKLSVRLVTIIGACVFILFGISTLLFDARLDLRNNSDSK
ncbi:unnamed protein product [Gordionus sp. m RMFG-2023]